MAGRMTSAAGGRALSTVSRAADMSEDTPDNEQRRPGHAGFSPRRARHVRAWLALSPRSRR